MSTTISAKLSKAPGHFPHNSPLFLFEETFGTIISQSKNIVIKYTFLDAAPDLGDGDTISIVSVNGFSSPDEFTHKLTDMITSAMSNFEDFLDSLAPVHAEPHLDQALLKIASLRNNITTDQLSLIQRIQIKFRQQSYFYSSFFSKGEKERSGNTFFEVTFDQVVREEISIFCLLYIPYLTQYSIHRLQSQAGRLLIYRALRIFLY